jgi:L,D-transpeptidase YbiS
MTKTKSLKAGTAAAAGVFLLLIFAGTMIDIRGRSRSRIDQTPAETKMSEAELQKKAKALKNRLAVFEPHSLYIVVDTGQNKLTLKKGFKIIKEVVVSCGSGGLLEEPGGKRKWIFDTPRGEFSVQSKLVNPTWIKPDWAFIEEGEKIPTNYNDRIDNDSLGSYALGFGDGYFIHGTLYSRLLGRNVTHGCVRVGDMDLESVFRAAVLGTRIYIF